MYGMVLCLVTLTDL